MSQRGADKRLVLEVEGFERAAGNEEVAEGCRAMGERRAIKTLLRP